MLFSTLLLLGLLSNGSAGPASRVLQRYAADRVHDWSSLILYVDYTFKYESRGDSCFAWQDWRGTWSKKGDLLYLGYSITIEESQERIGKMGSFSDPGRILVVVTTPEGAPIADALVTFNGHGYESATGADGRAFVSYDEIPEYYGPGTCKSKKLEELIVKDGKRTISFTIDQPQSNYFEVVLHPDPPSREESREDVYRIKKDTVILLEDGFPERGETFGDVRPRVLQAVDAADKPRLDEARGQASGLHPG